MVYIDIYGPFPTASWNDHEYFITFTDDYSRYGYLYLLHEKSQSLKIYKVVVENQLKRKLNPLGLIMVVNAMVDTTYEVDVQNHLLISKRVCHYRLVHHVRDTSSK